MTSIVDTYRIHLHHIRFRARHGALRAERDLLRDFVVDLSVTLPTSALPRTDVRSRVLDYDKLANLVVDEGTRNTYKLLETLAQRIVDRTLEETQAESVTVEVRKAMPPTSASVEWVSVSVSGRKSSSPAQGAQ